MRHGDVSSIIEVMPPQFETLVLRPMIRKLIIEPLVDRIIEIEEDRERLIGHFYD